MSTWHQDQVRTQLWHDTKWVVVTDPSNQLLTTWLCDTRAEAEDRVARDKANGVHSYILNPRYGSVVNPVAAS